MYITSKWKRKYWYSQDINIQHCLTQKVRNERALNDSDPKNLFSWNFIWRVAFYKMQPTKELAAVQWMPTVKEAITIGKRLISPHILI